MHHASGTLFLKNSKFCKKSIDRIEHLLYSEFEQKFYRTVIRFKSPVYWTIYLIYSSQISRKGIDTMETTMYTFTANEIVVAGSAIRQACGGDRRMVYLRHPVNETAPATGGKVIDFNAWREAQEEKLEEPTFEHEFFDDEFAEAEFSDEDLRTAPRRPRTSHRVRGMYLDWAASAAVIVVALCASISFFL